MPKLAKRLVDPDSGLICPDHYSGPDWVYTDGPAVAEINDKADFTPDPQQQLGLDLIFALGDNWLPAAFSFCVICARQNLKTGLLKQACVGWLSVTEEHRIVWSSHELTTTIEAQTELHELFESSPALSRLLPATKNRGKYDDNLNKRIELTTGQKVLFKARTQTGGRGLAGDKTVLDEALFLKPSHTASLLPIMMARPNGQVLYASSPGLLDSAVLRDVRDRGRAGMTERMYYLEWGGHWRDCADPDCTHPKDAVSRGIDCAADDRELWALNNPTVSTGRITLERIADMRQELLAEDFIRECMGKWDDPADGVGPPAIDLRTWNKLGSTDFPAPARAAVVLDVEPDRSRATVNAAGKVTIDGDDRVLLMTRVTTVAGAIETLKKFQTNVEVLEVALHPSTQAKALVPGLLAEEIEFHKLTHQDVAAGCATVQTGVVEGRIAHLQQDELATAVAIARTRMVSEAEIWERRDERMRIAPIAGCSAALHRWDLLEAAEAQTPPPSPEALPADASGGHTRRTAVPAHLNW